MWKQCTICKRYKALWEFYKDKSKKFGVKSQCKECRKVRMNNKYANDPVFREACKAKRRAKWINDVDFREAYYTYQKNRYANDPVYREARKNYQKKWHENNREAHKTYNRKWAKDNREARKNYNRKWHGDNREVQNARSRKWAKDNKDRCNTKSAKRRAMKLNQTPELTGLGKERILNLYKLAKALPGEWHVDHIIPLSKGGLHHPDNLQVIPAEDNLKKNAKLDYHIPNSRRFILSYN